MGLEMTGSPTPSPEASRRVRFDVFELDLDTGELSRDGSPLGLPPQPTKVLQLLVERAGRLVTRKEFRDHLWPDTVVEYDHGLNTCIRQIREVLGEAADTPSFIQTVPRRGYRFVASTRVAMPTMIAEGPHASRRLRGSRRWRIWLGAAVGLLIVALTVAGVASREDQRRVAVLPFQNLSPSELPPHFVQGLSEELIVELARHDPAELAVISRGSANRYGDDRLSTREIAAALAATHLVVGTVRYTGATLEVTASLVRARDETTIWSARYATREFDPLAQMGSMGRRIAAAMDDDLVPGAAGARSSPDQEARAELLKGRYHLVNHRPADAAIHLERAVRRDPRFGLAHALLAQARLSTGDSPGAEAAAARAIELQPGLAEAHQAVGDVAARTRWEWGTALREYRTAIELEPGNAELRQGNAYLLSLLGRHDEAIAEMDLALSLDPVSPLVNGDAAWLYLYARRYSEAVDQARATVGLDPELAAAWYCLVTALEAEGKSAEARIVAGQVAERYGASPTVVAEIGALGPEAGLDRFWRWDLEQMWENDLSGRYPLEFAAAYARFRQPSRALAFIERGIESGVAVAPIIAVDPRFDEIRSDPRFARALARLHLPASIRGS